jgi:hypothetical protein
VEYYCTFKDYLQLKGIIADIRSSLNDENELNIFISHATYSNNGGSSNNTNSQEQSNVNFLDTQQENSPSISYPPSSRQAQSNAYDSSDSEEDMDFH